MSDHYAALGLGSDASLADIKKAFRQKAALFHPDRNTAADASARFRAVQEAYDVLADATNARHMTTTGGATCWTTRWKPPATSGKTYIKTVL
jgi:DnaJ-class molecular chaperone